MTGAADRAAKRLRAAVPPLLIVGAAVAMRLWALRYQPTVTFDGTEYVRYAQAIGHGGTFPSVFSPGYPALIALAHVFVSDRTAAAVAVSMVAGALLPLAVWLLARPALGTRAAWLPAVAVSLHPMLASYSAMTMSESAYITTVTAAVALAAARKPVWSGAMLGLGFAIRPEGLGVAAVLGCIAALEAKAGRLAWRGLAVGFAAFLGPVLACVLYQHAATGAWTLTPKLSAFHAATPDWRSVEPGWTGAPRPATDLGSIARDAPANAIRHAEALLWVWPWPLLVLSLWGLWLRRGFELALIAPLVVFPFLGLTQQGRFELPLVPALAVLATLPLTGAGPRSLRWGAVALAIGGVVASVFAMGEAFRTPAEGGAIVDRHAGEWLARIVRPGDTVLDRKPFVAYYAGLPHRVLPDVLYEDIVGGAVRERQRWLVLQEYVVRQMRPQLAPLLDNTAFREREPRLEMVYAAAETGQGSLAIFRVLRQGESKSGDPPVVVLDGRARGAQ